MKWMMLLISGNKCSARLPCTRTVIALSYIMQSRVKREERGFGVPNESHRSELNDLLDFLFNNNLRINGECNILQENIEKYLDPSNKQESCERTH